ncbi:MAG: glycosyltransferase family 4 protein [Acidobacteriota bacterium]
MITLLFMDTERVWRGGQDQLLTLLRGLREHKHRVHLICHPATLLEQRACDAGIGVHPLRIPRELGLVALLRLRKIIGSVRPQVLAFNTPRAIIVGNLASRRSSVRVRLIFRRVSFPLRQSIFTRRKYTWGIDCIVAISDSIKKQLQAGGVPPARIRTIYEGLDLSLYPDREANGKPQDPSHIVIGTLASLSPEKGLDYLVEAASMIPRGQAHMRFVVVGEGECRRDLESRVQEKNLADIFQFTGFQGQTLAYLRSFDVFVLPSLSEGLSSAILAAMAASLPVVATDVGGIPELVRDGENGILVPPRDPAALAAALLRLSRNPEEARAMGQRGRRRVEEEFTLERKIRETEELCSSLLESNTAAYRKGRTT